MAALIDLIPFFIPHVFPSMDVTSITAIGLALVTLFGLGAFLGRISRRSIPIYGLRTVVVGIISIAISLLLGENS